MSSLSIVIVNWNTGHLLRACTESIANVQAESFRLADVVIVDNASTDDSLAFMGPRDVSITIIRNTTNRGFGAACNQGADLASGDYLLFLNPDTQLYEQSLAVPVAFMDRPENGRIGICGIQLVDRAGVNAESYRVFPSVRGFFANAIGLTKLFPERRRSGVGKAPTDQPLVVDQVIGAFFLIRRSLFQALGGFDERFFVYFEEVDLSLRARQAGWSSVCLQSARAFHEGGGSSKKIKARRLYYSLRSRLQYGFKHLSSFDAWLLVAITLVLEPISRLAFAIGRGAWTDLRNTATGYGLLARDLPNILGKSDRAR